MHFQFNYFVPFWNDTRFSVIFLVKRNQVVSNCRVDQQLTFFVISPSWKNFPLPFLYLNRSDAWSQWKWKKIFQNIYLKKMIFCHHFFLPKKILVFEATNFLFVDFAMFWEFGPLWCAQTQKDILLKANKNIFYPYIWHTFTF